jgi:type II secretory pathway pseudopilin PulG
MDVGVLAIAAVALLFAVLFATRSARRRAERRTAARRARARQLRRRRVPEVSANVRGLATETPDLWAEEVEAPRPKGRAA